MGACVASRLGEEEEVVSICRERKQQLKSAVERRYTLADAHYRYCQSLYGVSAAIKLFVARHSSLSSPFMITYPPPCPSSPPKENVVSNPLFLQQAPSEPTKKAIASQSCVPPSSSADSSSSSQEEEEEIVEEIKKDGQPVCGYYYMEPSSPQIKFGWDFFNPFTDVKPEIINGYNRITEEELRVLREQEGIPELEEDGERWEEEDTEALVPENINNEHENRVEVVKAVDTTTATVKSQVEKKGLNVIDTPEQGRELLEALKDIEDYFLRAYDSGKDVSRMLEVNRVQLQSNLEEIKESPTKIIQAITWRSTSRSSSCKSLVASSSKSSSAWTEFKNDLFDDYGGMDSGSHSLTLGRLYAWEKKLYEEVKAGDDTRKLYERKCHALRNQDVRGDEGLTVDKTRAAVKDLYSRILVAIRSAETISNRIEKLRDEELQPQINELLQGMMRSWKIMLEAHEIQNKIMFEVKAFTSPTYVKFCNDSHRLATLQLEAELLNWRTCFIEYVAAQKAYVEALHGWLAKFVVPEVEFYTRSRSSAPSCGANGPPLLIICRDWLVSLEKLPKREVSCAIKCCGKDVRALWMQQGEEQKQKRKVDSLTKELERKVLGIQKAENRMFELRLTEHSMEGEETDHQAQSLIERKDFLNDFKRKVDLEKEEHQNCVLETQKLTLNGFQTGFCRVFESMKEFSKASFNMYNDLLCTRDHVQIEDSTSNGEGSHTQVDNTSFNLGT